MTPLESRIIDLARRIVGANELATLSVVVLEDNLPSCDAEETIQVKCPCGAGIAIAHKCHDRLAGWQVEDACTAVQDPDLAMLLRELDLALVSLDLERIAS